ncbi:hypothetical protein BJ508DRAFT_164690 [Ascobolus immersus RN42]|uniref:MINDY deubiquitinase domain-containing protein n=1 Tax=Ascobolus immersus RN42 TaxID=1160509 RepID=A0A3N4I0P6_ASCIM|nr:hypothetical protein BJ508DRAFT_164690 [Ascobolus immersus RN42]
MIKIHPDNTTTDGCHRSAPQLSKMDSVARSIVVWLPRISTRVSTPDGLGPEPRLTELHIKDGAEGQEGPEMHSLPAKQDIDLEDEDYVIVSAIDFDQEKEPLDKDKGKEPVLEPLVDQANEDDSKNTNPLDNNNNDKECGLFSPTAGPLQTHDLKIESTAEMGTGDTPAFSPSSTGELQEQQQKVVSFNATAQVFVPKRRVTDNTAPSNITQQPGFVQQPSPQHIMRGYPPRLVEMDQSSSIFNSMPYSALPQMSMRTASVDMRRSFEQTYTHWKSLGNTSPPYKWREVQWRDPTDAGRKAAKRNTRVLVGTEENSSLIVALINALILTTPLEGPRGRVEMLLNRASKDHREIHSSDVLSAAVEDIRDRTGDRDKDFLYWLLRWELRVDLDQHLFATPLLDSFADTEDYQELRQILGSIPLLHGFLLSPKGEKDVLQAYTKYFHSLNEFRTASMNPQKRIPEEDLALLDGWIQKHSNRPTSYGISQIIGRLGPSRVGLFFCNNAFYTVMTCNGIPNKIRDIQSAPSSSEPVESRVAEFETKVFQLLTDSATDCTAIDAVWRELRSDNEVHYYTGDFQRADPVRKKWTLHSSADSWRGFLGVKNRLNKQAKIELIVSSSDTSSVGRVLPHWDSIIERIENNNGKNLNKVNSVANSYNQPLSTITEETACSTRGRSLSNNSSQVASYQSTRAPSMTGSVTADSSSIHGARERSFSNSSLASYQSTRAPAMASSVISEDRSMCSARERSFSNNSLASWGPLLPEDGSAYSRSERSFSGNSLASYQSAWAPSMVGSVIAEDGSACSRGERSFSGNSLASYQSAWAPSMVGSVITEDGSACSRGERSFSNNSLASYQSTRAPATVGTVQSTEMPSVVSSPQSPKQSAMLGFGQASSTEAPSMFGSLNNTQRRASFASVQPTQLLAPPVSAQSLTAPSSETETTTSQGLTAEVPENWTRPPVRQPLLPPPIADLEAGRARPPEVFKTVAPESNFSSRRCSGSSRVSSPTRSESAALKIFDPFTSSHKPVFQPLAAPANQETQAVNPEQMRGFTFADFERFMAIHNEQKRNASNGYNNGTGALFNGLPYNGFISNPNSGYNSPSASVYGSSAGSARPSCPGSPHFPGFRGLTQAKDANGGSLMEITNHIMSDRGLQSLSSPGSPPYNLSPRPGEFLGTVNWEEQMRMNTGKRQPDQRRTFSNGSVMSIIPELPVSASASRGRTDIDAVGDDGRRLCMSLTSQG